MRPRHLWILMRIAAMAAVLAMVVYANFREVRRPRPTVQPPIGTPGAPTTSRADLARTIADLDARLAANPDDAGVAVRLADALLRQARVRSDGAQAVRAGELLEAALTEDPGDYEALRMLGAIYLSQHRFRDAVAAAARARDLRPRDAWNYGVLGDGYLEIGEYDRAFDAYQTMVNLRPDAAAYARVSHALELQGDLARALELMKMAAEATSAHDPESQAWHYAQIGNLYFQMGRLADADREYRRAAFVFPGHPYAETGIARVKAAAGNLPGALERYRALMEAGPTPEIAAAIGDLHARMGGRAAAERAYATAERLEREGWRREEPQPAALARFLAERDRKIDEAVALAERAAATRRDIHTMDALAWAYYKAGRIDHARRAAREALRTGTRDRRILYHAAAIHRAAGDHATSRTLVDRALDGHPRFDLIAAPAAAALRQALGAKELLARTGDRF